MRESWTDDRLDDLNGKVDALRVDMKSEFTTVRGEMREGFEKMDKRGGVCAALITALAGLIATQL